MVFVPKPERKNRKFNLNKQNVKKHSILQKGPLLTFILGIGLVFIDYGICIREVNGIFRYVSNCLKKMV